MPGSIPASATAELPVGFVGGGDRPGPSPRRVALRRFFHHPAGVIGLVLTTLLVGIGMLASHVAPGDPFAYAGKPLQAPSAAHWFGTDNLGRDVAKAIVHGMRTSAVVVLWVVVIATVIGIAIG